MNFIPKMCKKVFVRCGVLMVLLCLLGASCDILKLGKAIDQVEEKADIIGANLGSGLIEGIDTAQLDSLVNRLVRGAGNTLNEEIDGVSIQNLEDQLRVAVIGILNEGRDSLNAILADTSALENLDVKMQGILSKMTRQINKAIADLIPNALNDRNLGRIYALRDSMLGPTTARLLEEALLRSMDRLIDNPKLDTLIAKFSGVVNETTEKIDTSVFKIDKTVARIGGIILSIIAGLAVLFFVLWLRKRSQNKQQKELLVNLTKAIDSIPKKSDYDQTIAFLQHQINTSDPRQHKLLNDILEEHKDQYTQKNKYKNYERRLIEYLKNKNQDRSISQQIYSDVDDEDFKDFVRRELE